MPKIKIKNEDLDNIRNLYLNGNSTVSISKVYDCSPTTILNHLLKMGIEINRKQFIRKYSLNETYFDVVDTQNKAYILGFLYADGNVNLKKYTTSISLQEEDSYILEKMRIELKSEKPLEYINYVNKDNFGYHYKNQYRLLFFSKYLCKSLINKGVMPNKSLKLKFPSFLNKSLIKHFIRGYFDGDGSFCFYNANNGHQNYTITFTSTQNFCEGLQNFIINELNIPCGNIYDASCHNGITKVLSFSGKNQTKTFLDWLYSDADMYLKRKYNKYIKAFYLDNSKTE